jgi:hypothetical protein
LEIRTRDSVILDYEVDFPTSTRLEWSLYSLGAARFTAVALGSIEPWGRHRRAGVLEIAAPDYDQALASFAQRTNDREFISRLSDTFVDACGTLESINRVLEGTQVPKATESRQLLTNLVDVLAKLMAFHVLNWAIPFEDIERTLTSLLGSRRRARESLLRMLVPITSAHMTDFYELAAAASLKLRNGEFDRGNVAELASAVAYLQAPGLAKGSFEEEEQLVEYLTSFEDKEWQYAEDAQNGREVSRWEMQREVWLMVLATDGSVRSLDQIAALVGACRLAAEEEEQRRRFQARSLRNLRRICNHHGFDLDEFVPRDVPDAPRPSSPLLGRTLESWRWLHAG